MSNDQQDQHHLCQIAIWVDHREAIIVNFDNAHLLREEEILSEVSPHTHGGGWSQKRIDAHRHAVLDHYYEQIIKDLTGADEIIIYGPGQAKHELHQHIKREKALGKRVINLVTTDKLNEHQFVGMALRDLTSNRLPQKDKG